MKRWKLENGGPSICEYNFYFSIFLFVNYDYDYDFLSMIVLYQFLVLDLSLYIFKQRISMIDFVTRLSITTSF